MQAAAAAALDDDAHVEVQRERYDERRELRARPRSPAHGLVHDGGDALFYLWLRADDGADDGWEIAARLAHEAGLLVSPGDLYGAAGADHVRLALVQPDDRLELALDRLVARDRLRSDVSDDLAKLMTQLWEAGDDWRDVHARRAMRTTRCAT